jgi:hypothetical protein
MRLSRMPNIDLLATERWLTLSLEGVFYKENLLI